MYFKPNGKALNQIRRAKNADSGPYQYVYGCHFFKNVFEIEQTQTECWIRSFFKLGGLSEM